MFDNIPIDIVILVGRKLPLFYPVLRNRIAMYHAVNSVDIVTAYFHFINDNDKILTSTN